MTDLCSIYQHFPKLYCMCSTVTLTSVQHNLLEELRAVEEEKALHSYSDDWTQQQRNCVGLPTN